MSDAFDPFPGFQSRTVSTAGARIFARIGGEGPPLVLQHGFPETGAMWHRVAPELAKHFTLVIPDLRGYGWSSAPGSHGGEIYTKRAMGADVVALMEDLGHARFAFAGHDRGGRVGYRLALDHPGRISKLALLDIAPTEEVWKTIEAGTGASPHWPWLAQPEPEPENAIKADPDGYFFELMRKWSGGGSLDAFDPRALEAYRAAWGDPSRIHAMCEDYRAGANQDRVADQEDLAAGKQIACPLLVLASADYLEKNSTDSPEAIWKRTFAPHAEVISIDCGHFIAEEKPAVTAEALVRFLAG